MRAHGDSSANSVGDTFAKASDNSQANLNGGSPPRAALGQVKESCPAGRWATRLRIPKSLATQLLRPANLSPSPSNFFERARGKVFMFILHEPTQRGPPDCRE